MVDAISPETLSAASPATDGAARETEVLSGLTQLALQMARTFQALGVAALKAGDLDRGGDAETHFSSLFLGIRRAVALKARLREQREEAQRKAEHRRESRQKEKDDRRQAVAQGVAQAIAVVADTEAKERLTVDLWDRLTEDERIDVDLADTALPIEALIASLCRALGLPPHWPGGPHRPGGAGPAGTGKAEGGPAAGDTRGTSGPPGDGHGASGTTAGAMAPPRSVPLRPAGGGQGGSGPPATAPPGEDPAERQGREHDRRRPAA